MKKPNAPTNPWGVQYLTLENCWERVATPRPNASSVARWWHTSAKVLDPVCCDSNSRVPNSKTLKDCSANPIPSLRCHGKSIPPVDLRGTTCTAARYVVASSALVFVDVAHRFRKCLTYPPRVSSLWTCVVTADSQQSQSRVGRSYLGIVYIVRWQP